MSQEIKSEAKSAQNGRSAAAGTVAATFAKIVGNADANGKVETSPQQQQQQQQQRMRLVSEADDKVDPFCDPNKPQRISFHDVTSAAFLIKGGVERTPCPVSVNPRGTFGDPV